MDPLTLAGDTVSIRGLLGVPLAVVAVVFAYASASKLMSISDLVVAIREYGIVPDGFAHFAAGTLIVGESLIAFAHLVQVRLQVVVPTTIFLLCVLFAFVATLLKRGEKRPCLCFGRSRDDSIGVLTLVRIGLLLVVECTIYFYVYDGRVGIEPRSIGSAFESLAVAVPIVILAGWCLSIPGIIRACRVVRS